MDQITQEDVTIHVDGVDLPGQLTLPPHPCGLVIFAHGSGSSRLSTRNIQVADELVQQDCGTLLFDLLTEGEASDRRRVFDIPLLGQRMVGTTRLALRQSRLAGLPFGIFGASTGAAAALVAAADPECPVDAIVSRGGRPDLAGAALADVTAPTLLLVGSLDHSVLDLNRQAQRQMKCETELEIIYGATHLFEEPGKLHEVATRAAKWFVTHFAAAIERE
jgi:alpha-beta hydrolase superfamily lysophospholipase